MYAIRVQNVTKKYKLGFKKDSLRDMIPAFFKRKNLEEKAKSEFLALDNVSFDVKKGEILGIIGQNGAGKTTILKLLSKITNPTMGNIEVNGKMSALIEVGAGFHPDLTGRENIYLNGSILGIKKKELDEKFDKIVEFAELEKFIDTPVRFYSSGMYVRLGFSISAHIEPEILLIDEVLSVGDMKFQMKCLNIMEKLKKRGTTIIFISHNLTTVLALCTRAILLSKGHIIGDDDTDKVVNAYKIRIFDEKKTDLKEENSLNNNNDREVIISGVRPIVDTDNFKNQFMTGDKIIIGIKYNAYKNINNPVFSIGIYRADGICCYETNTLRDKVFIKEIKGEGLIKIVYDKMQLLPGKYYVNAGIYEKQAIAPFDLHERVYEFEMHDGKVEKGICHFDHSWVLDS